MHFCKFCNVKAAASHFYIRINRKGHVERVCKLKKLHQASPHLPIFNRDTHGYCKTCKAVMPKEHFPCQVKLELDRERDKLEMRRIQGSNPARFVKIEGMKFCLHCNMQMPLAHFRVQLHNGKTLYHCKVAGKESMERYIFNKKLLEYSVREEEEFSAKREYEYEED